VPGGASSAGSVGYFNRDFLPGDAASSDLLPASHNSQLAGYAIRISLAPVTVPGQEPKSQVSSPPKIDHILLEVSNLPASIAFCWSYAMSSRLKGMSHPIYRVTSFEQTGLFAPIR
jgi:hypothetical protein